MIKGQVNSLRVKPGSLIPPPMFAVNLADLGGGAADISLSSGADWDPATFTRATTAWTCLSTGLWAQVASGIARSYYDAAHVYRGYLAEAARTNLLLQSRDLTNATSWTKVNGTATKDQTGIDGAANSASKFAATSGNATVLQAITLASAVGVGSFWLKRISGSGNVQLTINGGTAWTTQTISSNWTQFWVTGTQANPSVGIRIVTSGDAVAIDMGQYETAVPIPSTPIPTTTASATRNQDVFTFSGVGNFGAQGSLYFEAMPLYVDASGVINCRYVSVNDNTGNERIEAGITSASNKQLLSVDGNVTQASVLGAVSSVGVPIKLAGRWKLNSVQLCADGSLATEDTVATMPTTSQIDIGRSISVATYGAFGSIKNLKLWKIPLTNAQLQALTT